MPDQLAIKKAEAKNRAAKNEEIVQKDNSFNW